MWQFNLIPIGLQLYNIFHFQIISIVVHKSNMYTSSTLGGKKWRRCYQGGGGSHQGILAWQIQNIKSFVLIQICTVTSHSAYVATTPNQTELRLMVSKSFFNVDSKNVSEKFLHRHSWKNGFFFQNLLPWGTKGKNLKKRIFSGVTVEELFAYIFGIYIKKGFRNHQS